MHALRCTIFSSPEHFITTVVLESDVPSFSEILAARPSEGFLTHDVFEFDGDIVDATAHAMRRYSQKEQFIEQNMAISFFWNAATLGRQVSNAGTLMNDLPAPYGVEECRQVLLQLYTHPNYDDQTVITTANDGTLVTLTKDGEVKVG